MYPCNRYIAFLPWPVILISPAGFSRIVLNIFDLLQRERNEHGNGDLIAYVERSVQRCIDDNSDKRRGRGRIDRHPFGHATFVERAHHSVLTEVKEDLGDLGLGRGTASSGVRGHRGLPGPGDRPPSELSAQEQIRMNRS